MPRRKSLTRRLIQHLLLISLARTVLTAFGRGRAWDEWDQRTLDAPQTAEPRKHKRRFVQAVSFSALFFAGLALSAGAGNGVRTLLDRSSSAGAAGARGPRGPTGGARGAACARCSTDPRPQVRPAPAGRAARRVRRGLSPPRPSPRCVSSKHSR